MTDLERFEEKIAVMPDGCWDWTAGLDHDGYGRFWFGKRRWRAHRWSYERFVGSIPEGLTIDHLCRNRACVNPDHLEPVTNGENVKRGYKFAVPETHCLHGHEYTEENTYIRPAGHRECRTCSRARDKARYPR